MIKHSFVALCAFALVGCGGSLVGTGGGSIVYFTSGSPSQVFVSDEDGTGSLNMTSLAGTNEFPDLCLRTARVVYATNRDGIYQIYSDTIPPTTPARLTGTATDELYPHFSADGSKIVFVSTRDGHSEVYLMGSDGSGQTRLTDNDAGNSYPSFSPDGSKIVFVSYRDGGLGAVYTMNLDGSEQARVTTGSYDDSFPSFSEDGGTIVFRQVVDSAYRVATVPVGGGTETDIADLTDSLGYPSVGSNGRVYFNKAVDGVQQIFRCKLDGSDLTQITTSAGDKLAPVYRSP